MFRYISLGSDRCMMKRYMVSITEEMEKKIEEERKKRLLDSIPETIRMILSDYLSGKT